VLCTHTCLKKIFFKHAGKRSAKITFFLGTGVRLFQKQNPPLEEFSFFESSVVETGAIRLTVCSFVSDNRI